MEAKSKRNRTANFSTDEKILCLNVIAKFKNIIECKKTGGNNWSEKQKAWENVASEFNSQSTTYRSPECLKRFYYNKKKETRKFAAEEKSNLRATGGGPPPKKKLLSDTVFDLTLDLMNKKTVYGLKNKFDGDSKRYEAEDDMRMVEYLEDDEIACEIPNDLMEAVDCSLEPSKESEEKSSHQSPAPKHSNSKFNKSRRRPAANSATESVALKYQELANSKLEIAQLQLQVVKAQLLEIEIKKQRDEEEFQLRKESVLLDIELKKTKLRSLKNVSNYLSDA